MDLKNKRCDWCEENFSFKNDFPEPDLCDNCAEYPSYFAWLKNQK